MDEKSGQPLDKVQPLDSCWLNPPDVTPLPDSHGEKRDSGRSRDRTCIREVSLQYCRILSSVARTWTARVPNDARRHLGVGVRSGQDVVEENVMAES
jgi:hypothetical protein